MSQNMQNVDLIGKLRNKNGLLVKSIESIKAENSPLKRKLADMNVDLETKTKTKELTIAYTELAEFQKKIQEFERIRREKEQQLALQKQIEDRIAARMAKYQVLEQQKEEVIHKERAAETKHIAHLKQFIKEKEKKDKDCCIM